VSDSSQFVFGSSGSHIHVRFYCYRVFRRMYYPLIGCNYPILTCALTVSNNNWLVSGALVMVSLIPRSPLLNIPSSDRACLVSQVSVNISRNCCVLYADQMSTFSCTSRCRPSLGALRLRTDHRNRMQCLAYRRKPCLAIRCRDRLKPGASGCNSRT
jgi:hypothetical protein